LSAKIRDSKKFREGFDEKMKSQKENTITEKRLINQNSGIMYSHRKLNRRRESHSPITDKKLVEASTHYY